MPCLIGVLMWRARGSRTIEMIGASVFHRVIMALYNMVACAGHAVCRPRAARAHAG